MAVTECKPVRAENIEADTRAVEHEKEFEGRNDDEPQPTFSILCSPITYFDEDGDFDEEAALARIPPPSSPVKRMKRIVMMWWNRSRSARA